MIQILDSILHDIGSIESRIIDPRSYRSLSWDLGIYPRSIDLGSTILGSRDLGLYHGSISLWIVDPRDIDPMIQDPFYGIGIYKVDPYSIDCIYIPRVQDLDLLCRSRSQTPWQIQSVDLRIYDPRSVDWILQSIDLRSILLWQIHSINGMDSTEYRPTVYTLDRSMVQIQSQDHRSQDPQILGLWSWDVDHRIYVLGSQILEIDPMIYTPMIDPQSIALGIYHWSYTWFHDSCIMDQRILDTYDPRSYKPS